MFLLRLSTLSRSGLQGFICTKSLENIRRSIYPTRIIKQQSWTNIYCFIIRFTTLNHDRRVKSQLKYMKAIQKSNIQIILNGRKKYDNFMKWMLMFYVQCFMKILLKIVWKLWIFPGTLLKITANHNCSIKYPFTLFQILSFISICIKFNVNDT